MGQGSINNYIVPAGSNNLMTNILTALKAVHEYYDIDTTVQQQKIKDQLNSPDSPQSKASQEETSLGIEALGKELKLDPAKISQLQMLIKGQPGQAATEGTPGTPGTPGLQPPKHDLGWNDPKRKPGVGKYYDPAAAPGPMQDTPGTTAVPGRPAVPGTPGVSAAYLSDTADHSLLSDLVKQKLGLKAAAASKSTDTSFKLANLQESSNSAYDRVIGKPFEARLDAAGRVKKIFMDIKNGTLIPSDSIAQTMATDINLLGSPTGQTNVTGTQHAKPRSFFGDKNKILHYLSGKPKATISPDDLKNWLAEVDSFSSVIGEQHQNKFNSWIKGQSDIIKPYLIDRYNTSRMQYFPPNDIKYSFPQNVDDPSNDLAPHQRSAIEELKRRQAARGRSPETAPPDSLPMWRVPQPMPKVIR